MTDPRTSGPLAVDVVSHVRHDLRTFANHILGYSDMLLEVARDEVVEFVAPLEEIHTLGKTLLDRTGETLAATRTDCTTGRGLRTRSRCAPSRKQRLPLEGVPK